MSNNDVRDNKKKKDKRVYGMFMINPNKCIFYQNNLYRVIIQYFPFRKDF